MSRVIAIIVNVLLLLFPLVSPRLVQGEYRFYMMPKLTGIAYYDAVRKGAEEADEELADLEVIWEGPSQDLVEKQIDMIEKMIPGAPDLIGVAANDPVAIVPVLKKANAAGIHVMSWDGDTQYREFFVNLVDFDEFGRQIVEALQEETGPEGDIGLITTTFTAPNQASWVQAIKRVIYSNYPGLNIVDYRPAGESTDEAYRVAQDYLKTFPELVGIIVLGVPNVPGVAQAVKDAGLAGRVAVVGNGTPNLMRPYLKDGTVRKSILWSAPDHGYLTVYCAYQLLKGELAEGRPFKAGRLGTFTPVKDDQNLQVLLPVMVFTRENVDEHNF